MGQGSDVVNSDCLHVERALVNYYLGAGDSGSAGPVRFIDASRPTLARALGLGTNADPMPVLARGCDGADSVARVLADGWSGKWPDSETPGFFRYLVLTCAVVALADRADSREFGGNLAAIFRCGNVFQDRKALPKLWARLSLWCRRMRAKNVPLREFVLPSEGRPIAQAPRLGNIVHLRPTYEVAFPTWRDISHLRTLLSRRQDLADRLNDPFEVARVLCPILESDAGFHDAMRQASIEFRKLYEGKATLLRLHRFWGAVHAVLAESRTQKIKLPPLLPVLEIQLGNGVHDAAASLFLKRAGIEPSGQHRDAALLGSVSTVIDNAGDWLRRQESRGFRGYLSTALPEGVMILAEVGFARWATPTQAGEFDGRCLLLRRESRRRDLLDFGKLAGRPSVGWELRGPFEGTSKQALLSKLGLVGFKEGQVEPDIRVVDGIRVATALLGRSRFLPRLVPSGRGNLSLVPSVNALDGVQLTEGNPREFELESRSALNGSVRLRLTEAPLPGMDPLILEKQLRFVPFADEHVELPTIESSRWHAIDELQVVASAEIQSSAPLTPIERASPFSEQMEDLMELVYAIAARGCSELDLIAIVNKVKVDLGLSPWEVLRSLQECGWLHVTQATNWRVRCWWLRPPTLTQVEVDGDSIVVLNGSCPEVIRRRFITTTKHCGGNVVGWRTPSAFASSLIGAVGIDVAALQRELRWPLARGLGIAVNKAPSCWPVTSQDPARHSAVARWCMTSGRFSTAIEQDQSDVTLIRYQRDASDRPDLFTVTGGRAGEARWVSSSRTSAILEAYRRANRPMFEVKGEWLVRIPSDGYLPLPIAQQAGLRMSRTSGPYWNDTYWTYAYPLDVQLLAQVRHIFGEAIVRTSGSAVVSHTPNRLSSKQLGRSRARGGQRQLRIDFLN